MGKRFRFWTNIRNWPDFDGGAAEKYFPSQKCEGSGSGNKSREKKVTFRVRIDKVIALPLGVRPSVRPIAVVLDSFLCFE